MSSQKKLIWLLSKDQDYINFTVYGVPDGLSTFTTPAFLQQEFQEMVQKSQVGAKTTTS